MTALHVCADSKSVCARGKEVETDKEKSSNYLIEFTVKLLIVSMAKV